MYHTGLIWYLIHKLVFWLDIKLPSELILWAENVKSPKLVSYFQVLYNTLCLIMPDDQIKTHQG